MDKQSSLIWYLDSGLDLQNASKNAPPKFFPQGIGMAKILDQKTATFTALSQCNENHVFFFVFPYMEFREPCQFICLVFTMGNRKISADLKECALRLWELGYDLGFISESLCISKASIYQWRSIFAEFSSVNRPPSPLLGRPRIIVRTVLTAIKEVYHNEVDAYLDELVWWLAIHHDIVISRSALHKNLLDAGLT
ncbi:uncharacterized protein LACBIDRAFT_327871 [Laccaria bicolor S238N-H82]|uniref:Predicted protein n=1 Tax=Laccaria bicolor (strain S238N-H82 / ATCC MYA-4686) TaxID=486041 RepID=B0DD21_LACBS|nr:uncharacterized protein LACBIDRAFT_327871 [Laccaria bicolor S238N-H82]EDR07397.1 predicted protein [Laccaria bicolor S238N-H82]|eukprot:XP_001881789.1 predicted protein [Laccaria bicolor S238N-H82]